MVCWYQSVVWMLSDGTGESCGVSKAQQARARGLRWQTFDPAPSPARGLRACAEEGAHPGMASHCRELSSRVGPPEPPEPPPLPPLLPLPPPPPLLLLLPAAAAWRAHGTMGASYAILTKYWRWLDWCFEISSNVSEPPSAG